MGIEEEKRRCERLEIEEVKRIIKQNIQGFPKKIKSIREAELYYRNENDIVRKKSKDADKTKNPLRVADNRESHAWFSLLVDQKASYTVSDPPNFDLDIKDSKKKEELNHKIQVLLGDKFSKIANDLCIQASCAGVSWVHVWRDAENNFFRYGVVDSKQIIPVYDKTLDKKLQGVLRIYEDYDENGDTMVIYEYWNDKECQTFRKKKSRSLSDLDDLSVYEVFTDLNNRITHTYRHDWGAIPFIPFRNNREELSDLVKVKGSIDVYDKVLNNYVDDVDDVQQIIFVLTNYTGEDKEKFLSDLRQYKMIKLESDEETQGKLDTLAIDIPVEARNKLLEIARESIFTLGQGVDPQRNIGQNNSGAALEFMYSLLELKASMLETEFRVGFGELVRFILRYYKQDPDILIKQTWTRSKINDNLNNAQIAQTLNTAGMSRELVAEAYGVKNVNKELENQRKDKLEQLRMEDDYSDLEEVEQLELDLDGDDEELEDNPVDDIEEESDEETKTKKKKKSEE